MNVIDELLELVVEEGDATLGISERPDHGTLAMPIAVAKSLLELAKTAFEINEPLYVDERMDRRECAVCGGWTTYHWGSRFNQPVGHEDWCAWKRMQMFRGELGTAGKDPEAKA